MLLLLFTIYSLLQLIIVIADDHIHPLLGADEPKLLHHGLQGGSLLHSLGSSASMSVSPGTHGHRLDLAPGQGFKLDSTLQMAGFMTMQCLEAELHASLLLVVSSASAMMLLGQKNQSGTNVPVGHMSSGTTVQWDNCPSGTNVPVGQMFSGTNIKYKNTYWCANSHPVCANSHSDQ